MAKFVFEGHELDTDKIEKCIVSDNKLFVVVDGKKFLLREYQSGKEADEKADQLKATLGDEKIERWYSQDEWEKRVNKFCPFTRQPCSYLFDANKGWQPENVAECIFLETDRCRFFDDIAFTLMDIEEILKEIARKI
jgi:hypothetical protein